jgi:hypothetical protein
MTKKNVVDLRGDAYTFEAESRNRLKNSDGNGTSDDMEQRVRHLENDMSFIKGKLEDMPTKDWMTTRLFAVVGAFLALTAVVQVVINLVSKAPPPG